MKFANYISKFENMLRCRLKIIVGLWLFLYLLLFNGAEIQSIVVGFFDVQSASVYDAAFGAAITLPGSFLDRFLSSFISPLPALCLAVSVLAALQACKFNVLVSVAMSLFLGLTLIDVYFSYANDGLTIESFLTNFFANLIGGFILAILAVAMMEMMDHLYQKFVEGYLRTFVCVVFPAMFGLSLAYITYVGVSFFLYPLSVRIDLVLEKGSSGYIAFDTKGSTPPDVGSEYQIIPKHVTVDRVNFIGGDLANMSWTKVGAGAGFKVEVFGIRNCFNIDSVEFLGDAEPIVSDQDVHTVTIGGQTTGRRIDLFGDNVQLRVHGTPITAFWVSPGEGDRQTSIKQFLSEQSRIEATSVGDLIMIFSGAAFDLKDEKVSIEPKDINVAIDGRKYVFVLVPEPADRSRKVECGAAKVIEAGEGKIAIQDTAFGGVVLKISRVYGPKSYYNNIEHSISIDEGNGWLTVPNISDRDLAGSISDAYFVAAETPQRSVAINGDSAEIPFGLTLQAMGEFRVSYNDTGAMLVSGQASALWIGGQRRNDTKWELLGSEYKLALATAMLGLFLWFGRIATNNQEWLSSRAIYRCWEA
jgi:hypothetical protein